MTTPADRLLGTLLDWLAAEVDRRHVGLDIVIGPQIPNGTHPMQMREFVIGDGPARYTVRPTHRGRPAHLDGPITVEVADPSLFSASVQPDGLSVLFADMGKAGETTATISADVKAGPDVVTKSVTVGLSAVEGSADSLDGDFGDQETPAGPVPPLSPPASSSGP